VVIRVIVVIGFIWRFFFSLLLLGVPLFKTPEGVVIGFQIFALNIMIPIENIFGNPPYPPHSGIFGQKRGVIAKVVLEFWNWAWGPK
jgi:hypothetical protein